MLDITYVNEELGVQWLREFPAEFDYRPSRGSDYAAGFDLKSADYHLVPAGENRLIKTGIALEIPEGYYGQIFPRSGLALKKSIMIMGGVVDSDYRAEVGVILFNAGDDLFEVQPGDRIAQMVFLRHYSFVPVVKNVSRTERGSGGFGSTGVS